MAHGLTKKSLLLLLAFGLSVQAHSSCSSINRGKGASHDHGDSTRSMTYDGRTRTYQVHIPPLHATRMHLPLVIVLHGGGGTGRKMKHYLTRGGFNALADEEGFAVVYPDGVERHWNDGRELDRYRAHREDVDDVGFISQLIDHHVATLRIDPRRIYVTGISNGGLMSYRLACQLTQKITAIAAVTASLSEKLRATCKPSANISVLIMNGTEDPLVPWDGGDIHIWWRTFGRVLSTRDTLRFWVERNRCSPSTALVEAWDENEEDGTRVRREVYGECKDDVEVVLYTIEGGGHTWPGGYQYLPEWIIGKTSLELNANETIWRFFKAKSRMQ
ncbi:MAG: PHB depolymerase family esterase [Desulfobacteraceae bacterium]